MGFWLVVLIPFCQSLLHPHQFILPAANANLFGVDHTRLPVGVGVEQVPVVVVIKLAVYGATTFSCKGSDVLLS